MAKKKKYKKAGETFELIQRTHPESLLVQKGQIYASWCYLQDHNGAEALGALELMENLHPGCPYMDLVFYLKALIYYEKRLDIKNNQEGLIWSLRVMRDLIKFYPTSPFSLKARKAMPLLEYTIFYHDILLATYFMSKGNYLPGLILLNNGLVYYSHTELYAQGLYYAILCAMGLDAPSVVKKLWSCFDKVPPCEEKQRSAALIEAFNHEKKKQSLIKK